MQTLKTESTGSFATSTCLFLKTIVAFVPRLKKLNRVFSGVETLEPIVVEILTQKQADASADTSVLERQIDLIV